MEQRSHVYRPARDFSFLGQEEEGLSNVYFFPPRCQASKGDIRGWNRCSTSEQCIIAALKIWVMDRKSTLAVYQRGRENIPLMWSNFVMTEAYANVRHRQSSPEHISAKVHTLKTKMPLKLSKHSCDDKVITVIIRSHDTLKYPGAVRNVTISSDNVRQKGIILTCTAYVQFETYLLALCNKKTSFLIVWHDIRLNTKCDQCAVFKLHSDYFKMKY